MINTINDEIPYSEGALVPVGIYLVRILVLVGDELVPLASLELHLLLEILVLVCMFTTLDLFVFLIDILRLSSFFEVVVLHFHPLEIQIIWSIIIVGRRLQSKVLQRIQGYVVDIFSLITCWVRVILSAFKSHS